MSFLLDRLDFMVERVSRVNSKRVGCLRGGKYRVETQWG